MPRHERGTNQHRKTQRNHDGEAVPVAEGKLSLHTGPELVRSTAALPKTDGKQRLTSATAATAAIPSASPSSQCPRERRVANRATTTKTPL
jgi:hypothetical protein